MCPDNLLLSLSGEHLQSVANYLSRSSPSSREVMILLLFAVVIGAIWTTIFLWDRFRRAAEDAQVASRTLFDELCEAHQLSHPEVALLADAAREFRLESPASFFVRPDRFNPLCTDSQPNAEAYRQLRNRLFGKLA